MTGDDSPVAEELNDRVVFLAEELLGTPASSTQAESCAAQITKKIKARKPTESINPGRASKTEVSIAAPWKHTRLHHHSFLRLASTTNNDAEKEKYKMDCFQFLNSDYTFMP